MSVVRKMKKEHRSDLFNKMLQSNFCSCPVSGISVQIHQEIVHFLCTEQLLTIDYIDDVCKLVLHYSMFHPEFKL